MNECDFLVANNGLLSIEDYGMMNNVYRSFVS